MTLPVAPTVTAKIKLEGTGSGRIITRKPKPEFEWREWEKPWIDR